MVGCVALKGTGEPLLAHAEKPTMNANFLFISFPSCVSEVRLGSSSVFP